MTEPPTGSNRRKLPPLVLPLQQFLSSEAAGGVVLVAAAAVALAWVNAPFGDTYERFWNWRAPGLSTVDLHLSLRQWVNDALMAVFFFVVGMEIKREVLRGELSDRRQAALPFAAAAGGMIVPAAIYLVFNFGGDGEHGWGVPMATDIAFAVGVLSLLGTRVPLSLKVFLLALAIVDDIGAIAVIALFYSRGIDLLWLALAAGIFLVVFAVGRAGVRSIPILMALGLAGWFAVHESGVHATIAGVALGLLIPADAARPRSASRSSSATPGEKSADHRRPDSPPVVQDGPAETNAPLDRLERALHPWTSFAVVPIFALANAGIALDSGTLSTAASSPVTAGVAFGLIIGKPLGILVFAWMAVRGRIASLPAGVGWGAMAAVALIAGIGFTVSLFIADVAFTGEQLTEDARTGILAGSAIMAAAGLAALHLALPQSAPAASSAARASSDG